MGRTHRFTCPNCEYSDDVSGCRAFGFFAVIETITCHDCKKLYDATANENTSDIPGDIMTYDGLTGICCPKSKSHRFSLWAEPWLCPKCATPMEEGGLYELWD
jgi:hypothetical protein